MKTNYFLIAAVAAFSLLSCSSEEKSSTEGEDVPNSKLSIRIVGETNTPKGRAAGEPTQADESKVNDFIVFVFKYCCPINLTKGKKRMSRLLIFSGRVSF